MNGRTYIQITRRAKARGVALLAALVVLLVGGVASAVPAPMCDEHAQSIAAPFPLFPSHNGEARADRPCKGKRSFGLGRAPTPERDQPPTQADGFDRAPPAERYVIVRDRGHAVRPVDSETGAPRPGYEDGIFRPPRVH